jgi:hypothetical protein
MSQRLCYAIVFSIGALSKYYLISDQKQCNLNKSKKFGG